MSSFLSEYNYLQERLQYHPVFDDVQYRRELQDYLLADMAIGTPVDDEVGSECAAYQRMKQDWEIVEQVKDSDRCIKNPEQFIPKEAREGDDAYHRRLARVSYSPWYKRLRNLYVGRVLRKPVGLVNVPDLITEHLENIDLMGNDINVFVKELFKVATDYGHACVLIDFPQLLDDQLTLRDVADANIRPYWLLYSPAEIIGWRSVTDQGRQILSQVRIRELVHQPSGDYGEIQQRRVRVFELVDSEVGRLCRYRTFVEETDGQTVQYVLQDQGVYSTPFIPLRTFYLNRTGFMESKPLLLEIANLNIKHFQLSSDLDFSIHIAAVPKLILFGYNMDNGDINVGVDEALSFSDPTGRLEWLSAPTSSFETQLRRIGDVVNEMQSLAPVPLPTRQHSGESSLSKLVDQDATNAPLASEARALQDFLDYCLEAHAAYLGMEEPGTFNVNRKFDLSGLDASMINTLASLNRNRQLSLSTFLRLLKDKEVLPDDFDEEAEISALMNELKMMLGSIEEPPPPSNALEGQAARVEAAA